MTSRNCFKTTAVIKLAVIAIIGLIKSDDETAHREEVQSIRVVCFKQPGPLYKKNKGCVRGLQENQKTIIYATQLAVSQRREYLPLITLVYTSLRIQHRHTQGRAQVRAIVARATVHMPSLAKLPF